MTVRAACPADAGRVQDYVRGLSLSSRYDRFLAPLNELSPRELAHVGTDADAGQAPWDVDLDGPTVLVFGGEGKGIRPRVAAACDGLIALPRSGAIGSLNVSAAATAVLFEAVRQRRPR